jgi:glucokinase
MIMFTHGTGVGGGIINNGETIDGENSHGSECGHIIIDSRDDARVCSCGHTGHLEAYASATALTRRTQEALEAGGRSSLAEIQTAGQELTALRVHEAAEAGDQFAVEIILETARYLGIGITTLLHTIDPAAVVLGGAMDFGGRGNQIGEMFINRVKQEVTLRAFPIISKRVLIDFASLGGDAGYLGAAGVARFQDQKGNIQ